MSDKYSADGMTMADYQEAAARTDKMTMCTGPLPYYVMGLCGEAGEVAGKVKKVFRDNDGFVEEKQTEEIAQELGDVLWYLTRLAWAIGLSLEQVAAMNANKLASRQERGVIGGSGDKR